MAGKETNFTLGTKGLNLVDEPLSLQDGDLQNAQNAEFRRDGGAQGIGLRGGTSRLNSADLGGTILGGAGVPLPSPLSSSLVRAFHAALSTGSATDTWERSTDGTTWAGVTAPARAIIQAKSPASNYLNQRCVSFNGNLVYSANDYTQGTDQPPVRVYDGTTDAEICTIPDNPASSGVCNTVLDYIVHRQRLFLAAYDPGPRGRVLELDLETGQLQQIGNAFDTTAGMPYCLCSHNGLLWVGTAKLAGAAVGRIYSFRVDVDTSWTLRVTTGAGQGYIRSMASFQGELYFGTNGDAGTDALLRVLENDYTTVTTSDTGSKLNDPDEFDALTVYDGALYCVYSCTGEDISQVRKFDGSSWTTDLDIFAAEARAAQVGQMFVNVRDTSLLVAFCSTGDGNSDGFIYRKVSGSWVKEVTGEDVRGFLGRVDTV